MGRYFNWESRGPESPLSSGLDSLDRGLQQRRALQEEERQRELMRRPYSPEETQFYQSAMGKPVYGDAQSHVPDPNSFIAPGPGNSMYSPPGEMVTQGAQAEQPIWGSSQPAQMRELSQAELLGKLSPEQVARVKSAFVRSPGDTAADRMDRLQATLTSRENVARANQVAASSRLDAILTTRENIAEARLELNRLAEGRHSARDAETLRQGRDKLDLAERSLLLARQRLEFLQTKEGAETGEVAEAEANLKAAQAGYQAVVNMMGSVTSKRSKEAEAPVTEGARKLREAKERAAGKTPSMGPSSVTTQSTTPKYTPSQGAAPSLNTSTEVQEPSSPEAVEAAMTPSKKAALEWLKQNPNDPRAPAIRKKLGL